MIKTIKEIMEWSAPFLPPSPICVETGCVYAPDPGNEEHKTTSNIVEHICVTRSGHLYSFDIDQEHINFAEFFCAPFKDRITFILGDSVQNLSSFKPQSKISLLLLDSKEFDPEHALKEYLAVQNNLDDQGHYVMVDDIHNPNSVKYKQVVPYLKELGYEYIEVPTPTGLFWAAHMLPLPKV